MCKHSDNVFGSLHAPGPIEMPKSTGNANSESRSNYSEDEPPSDTYVTKKGSFPKRDKSHPAEKKNDVEEEPPTKKLKSSQEEGVEEVDEVEREESKVYHTYTDKDVLAVSQTEAEERKERKFVECMIIALTFLLVSSGSRRRNQSTPWKPILSRPDFVSSSNL